MGIHQFMYAQLRRACGTRPFRFCVCAALQNTLELYHALDFPTFPYAHRRPSLGTHLTNLPLPPVFSIPDHPSEFSPPVLFHLLFFVPLLSFIIGDFTKSTLHALTPVHPTPTPHPIASPTSLLPSHDHYPCISLSYKHSVQPCVPCYALFCCPFFLVLSISVSLVMKRIGVDTTSTEHACYNRR